MVSVSASLLEKLADIDFVIGLQSNLRTTFENPQGKESMRFLEELCGWFQSVLSPVSSELTLVNDGKRQVLATLKTLITEKPEVIVQMARQLQEGE